MTSLKKLLENTISIPVNYGGDDSSEIVFDVKKANGSAERKVHLFLSATFECFFPCNFEGLWAKERNQEFFPDSISVSFSYSGCRISESSVT